MAVLLVRYGSQKYQHCRLVCRRVYAGSLAFPCGRGSLAEKLLRSFGESREDLPYFLRAVLVLRVFTTIVQLRRLCRLWDAALPCSIFLASMLSFELRRRVYLVSDAYQFAL